MFDLEKSVRAWTDGLRSRGAFRAEDIVELESHLREEIDGLVKAGLSGEEAFLVAERRVGRPEALAAEYAKVHGEPWRGMAFDTLTDADRGRLRRELMLVAGLALAAALLAQVPRLFGADLFHSGTSVRLDEEPRPVLHAAGGRVLRGPQPAEAAPAGRRGRPVRGRRSRSSTSTRGRRRTARRSLLASLHLPVLLWLVVGLACTAGRWRDDGARMDFLRATGEAFIYGTLILCGGAVLSGFTILIFSAVGLSIERPWLRDGGHRRAGGRPGGRRVPRERQEEHRGEHRPGAVAHLHAPLPRDDDASSSPSCLVQRRSPLDDRDTLFAINAMLILVLALVIYNLTARRAADRREWTDWLNLALIVCASAVDAVALASIISRTLVVRLVAEPGRSARAERRAARRSRRPRRRHRPLPRRPRDVRRRSSGGRPGTCPCSSGGAPWSWRSSRRCSPSPEGYPASPFLDERAPCSLRWLRPHDVPPG